MGSQRVAIREARSDEIAALQGIEAAAGRLFAEIGKHYTTALSADAVLKQILAVT